VNCVKGKKPALKNRIWMLFGAALAVTLSLISIRGAFVSTVALEQTARCGAAEHRHSAACYEDNRLCCTRAEHIHNRNCYLVLLKDNDINDLLSHIDSDKSHSLETLILRTVDTAILYNEDLYLAEQMASGGTGSVFLSNVSTNTAVEEPAVSTPEAPGDPAPEDPGGSSQIESSASNLVSPPASTPESVQGLDISELNETISEKQIEPNIVLNENLYNASALSGATGNAAVLPNPVGGSGGISTLAVGDDQVDDNYTANFYINLDTQNNWVCIGNLPFERVPGSINNRYNLQIRTADIVDLVNEALGTSYTSSDFRVKYATSANSQSWTGTTLGTTYTNIGSNLRNNNSTQARYLRLTNSNGADVRFYTVTFEHADGTAETLYVKNDTKITLPAGQWKSGTVTYNGGQTYTVTSKVTFVSQTCTVTLRYPNGEVSTQTVTSGSQFTLPAGYDWLTGSTVYVGGERVTVNGNVEFTGSVPVYYTVTYQYPDKDSETETVKAGTQIELPGGYIWTVNGISYAGGDSVTVTGDTVCIGAAAPIQVRYTVNFPMQGYDYGRTVTAPGASPTVYGTTQTTATFTVQPAESATVRTVSQTLVRLTTNHAYGATYPVNFAGWESETGERISPYSRISWSELQAYDSDNDGYVDLTGQWTHGRESAVNFFVLYNANVGSTDGSSGNYTPSIYSTYASNPDTQYTSAKPMYNATTDAQALVNDPKIRDMYGEKADKMWMSTFPTDEEVFESLKAHVGRLTVDGEQVNVEDLNSNEYAIRWYKVVYYDDDGWHVDGKLTRKVGVIEVSKTFAGNDTLIGGAKTNFSITATNGTRTVTLNSGNAVDDGDGNPNTWFWRIEGVKYNEAWTITESTESSADVIHYAEWAVSDASVNSQTGNGTGGSVTVRGVTYASDLADPEWLRVDFNNIYYHKDSLMIKKADGVTGEALSGAQFRLYQNDVLMTFDYDSASGMYVYDPSGNGAYDTLSGSGYMNIAAKDFSFDNGPITVREIKAPANYNPVGDIKVGYTDTGQAKVGIIDDVDFATYFDGLLVVYNSANTMNVTAEKIWECDESEWQDITVQLFANGSANLAATLSGTQTTVVDLTAANSYRHTWTDLPIYAYGARVEWSIKELRIGAEACKADYTFANWAVSYDAAVYDADGNVTLAVHNTPSRPLLYLTKTNSGGTAQLGGATFSLVQVSASGAPVDGFVTRTATTNEQGVLLFDNLLYGARYRITEERAPSGYKELTVPIYLTIAEGGVVVVDAHTHARADAVAYNVVVTNDSLPEMPETGGSGPGDIFGLGGGLMLLSACGYMLLQSRKKGRRECS